MKLSRPAAITLVLLMATVAYAALCSTGQQLQSAFDEAVIQVAILEEDVEWMWTQAELAAEEEAEAQYAVAFHMGWHGCNDPAECTALEMLLANLQAKSDATDCAIEAWGYACEDLDAAEEDKDDKRDALTAHRYSCQNCD